MADGYKKGFFGDDTEILFFILIFLCLFYSYGYCGRKY